MDHNYYLVYKSIYLLAYFWSSGNEKSKRTSICCKMRESCVYVHNIILCVEWGSILTSDMLSYQW